MIEENIKRLEEITIKSNKYNVIINNDFQTARFVW